MKMRESRIRESILELKKMKNAVILAHYYQRPEIQDLADAVGDSYFLSKVAKDCTQKVVVFCGVRFMAESAKILSPEKKILMPVYDAGCPMADMAEEHDVQKLMKKHPDAAVVSYINSSTEVKMLSDVCVTSSSAIKIIKNLPNKELIFLPDRNLGSYLAEQIPEKNFILWDGYCITHQRVNPQSIQKIKEKIPHVQVLVHPECDKPVRELADYIGSTSGIIEYATKSESKEFVVATEEGILHELNKSNPNKRFYMPGRSMTCVNMKKTTLEDVYACLEQEKHLIQLDENVRVKAFKALENMHQYAR